MKALTANLLALLCGALLVLLIEALLWVSGVAPLSDSDQFAGFGKQPVFVEEGNGRFVLNPAKGIYFNDGQSFLMPKPEGTFRIIAVGGSTTYGRPWLADTAFAAWMRRLLELSGASGRVEALNMGGISYASYRVGKVVTEALQYQPDLLLVYAGHNEFLEERTFAAQKQEPGWRQSLRSILHHSRIYSLMNKGFSRFKPHEPAPVQHPGEEIRARLEQVGGTELYHRDEKFRARVIRQYRDEMEGILRQAQTRNVPVILCTLPSNLAGISPFKSEHRPDMTAAAQDRFAKLLTAAEEALLSGAAQEALDILTVAEPLDPRFAHLLFLKGTALENLGQFEAAYAAYEMAKEEDIVPLRALKAFNAALRELAREYRVPLADIERAVRGASPNGIPGNVWFADHVHPTIAGQQLIAWELMDAATRAGLVEVSAASWHAHRLEAEELLARGRENLSARYEALGYWGVGRLYFWAGKYAEAYAPLEKAWQVIRDVAEIPRQMAAIQYMNGRYPSADDLVREALRIDPEDVYARQLAAQILARRGKVDEGLRLLDALEGREDLATQLAWVRGEILLSGRRFAAAIEVLAPAVEADESVASLRYAYARALRGAGRKADALQQYRRWLELQGRATDEAELQRWLDEPQTEFGQ